MHSSRIISALLGVWLTLPATASQFLELGKNGTELKAVGLQWRETADGLVLTAPAATDLYAAQGLFPYLRITPSGNSHFDFSPFGMLAVPLENLSPYPIDIVLEIHGELPDGSNVVYKTGSALRIGEKTELACRLTRIVQTGFTPGGVYEPFPGFPGRMPDLSRITSLVLMCRRPMKEFQFKAASFVLRDAPAPISETLKDAGAFYPCIDRFGQYRHAEWPGKIQAESDLAAAREREERDLADHPALPEGRTMYGGWEDGPSLNATGHFRTAKHEGRWYLVDPLGKLFWSFGIDCLYPENPTCVEGREEYFSELPGKDDPVFSRFFGRAGRTSSFYRAKGIDRPVTYDFHRANLQRKYGSFSPQLFARIATARLRSWGFNTIGNWNIAEIRQTARIPYVIQANAGQVPKLGTPDYNLYDVFAPGFQQSIENHIRTEYAAAAADPFCIGLFIDNEIRWDKVARLAQHVAGLKESTPARQALLALLRETYGTINRLNREWQTDYSDWNRIEGSRIPPSIQEKYLELTIRQYYTQALAAVRNAAPDKLYLGSRFAGFQTRMAAEAEAEFADVASFNLYYHSIAHYKPVADKPFLIGEFHFGTSEAGGSPGLQTAVDRRERAEAFLRYCESALYNPNCVGVHYFRYADQPVSGRLGDHENMQTGFVDVCDTPYPEMIEASRAMGRALYLIRENVPGQIPPAK